MPGLTPTQKTLKAQRGKGRLCAIAEKYVQIPGKAWGFRKDLFGIIDVVALDPVDGIIGIQSTGTAFSQHYKEMTTGEDVYKDTGLTKPEACVEWLKAGGRLELWSWRKLLKKRGGKLRIWVPRVHVFTEGDFE